MRRLHSWQGMRLEACCKLWFIDALVGVDLLTFIRW